MNGYNKTGFSHSLNGIVNITDGNGTTIENGKTSTGNIIVDDITSNKLTTTTLKSTYIEMSGDLTIDKNLTVDGLTILLNETNSSSLLDVSTYSIKINGGAIIKKNTYATDVKTDNIVSGNEGCGNLNSSNNITCVKLNSNDVNCKSVVADDVFYKNKICGWINLGIAPYLHIPLTTSLQDTTADIVSFNISTILTNANNNSIFLLPYYNVIFYNNNTVLCIIDNSYGLSPLFYQTIVFSQELVCTKILIQYKNITLL